MNRSNPCSNFDEWASLAQTDPAAFEERRSCLIEDHIQNSPYHLQRRLRGLQFRVDMERRRARTPMGACVRISSMMWDALLGEGGLRDSLNTLAGVSAPPRARGTSGTARIFKFAKPGDG
jgi:hypothetical protein